MPKRKRPKKPRPRLEPLIDLKFVKAFDHELRQHILLAALQDEVSPSELSKSLGKGLSQVSYHVKVLRDECGGMLRRTRTEQRRGALENYYRANLGALRPAESVAQIFALLDPEPAWDPAELSALVDSIEEASKARRRDK
ncbi:MAG TPA: winged helix-turn-helix domain-containing protein [Solirubrobacterales bacterium]|nr:winged helix-turn-helix domain-containing protein [Solirubrobacterales bacterium]